MRRFLIFLAVLVPLLGCAHVYHNATFEEAIQISKAKARELGVDLQNCDVQADETNTFWNRYAEDTQFYRLNPGLADKLSSRDFWVVSFLPHHSEEIGGFDAGVDVFVDKKDTKVFMVLDGSKTVFY